MTNIEYIYNTLMSAIVGLTNDRNKLERFLICPDDKRKKSKLFVRNTPLSLARLLTFMIMPRAGSCQNELEFFFEGIGFRTPSKSALSIKRKFLSPDIFSYLNDILLDEFYRSPGLKRWKGRYLIAVDGTTLTMPVGKRFESLYGYACAPQHASNRLPTARAIVLMDVLNDKILKMELGPYGSHEPELAIRAILALPEHILHNSIFIFDRLYLSSWLLTILQNNNIQYVIRCRRNFSTAMDEFFESKRSHCDVQIRSSHVAWLNKTSARFDKMGITPDQRRPIFLHLTKSVLPSGDMEVICSNTGGVRISAAQAYELYGRRWKVETAIGLEKNEWQIEIFSGYSKNAILQDICCKILSYNLCSMVISAAGRKLKRRHPKSHDGNKEKSLSKPNGYEYRVNVNIALFNFRRLLVRIVAGRKTLHALLIRYIEEASHYYQIYIPGRTYPRVFVKHKSNGKYATFTNYAKAL